MVRIMDWDTLECFFLRVEFLNCFHRRFSLGVEIKLWKFTAIFKIFLHLIPSSDTLNLMFRFVTTANHLILELFILRFLGKGLFSLIILVQMTTYQIFLGFRGWDDYYQLRFRDSVCSRFVLRITEFFKGQRLYARRAEDFVLKQFHSDI